MNIFAKLNNGIDKVLSKKINENIKKRFKNKNMMTNRRNNKRNQYEILGFSQMVTALKEVNK